MSQCDKYSSWVFLLTKPQWGALVKKVQLDRATPTKGATNPLQISHHGRCYGRGPFCCRSPLRALSAVLIGLMLANISLLLLNT